MGVHTRQSLAETPKDVRFFSSNVLGLAWFDGFVSATVVALLGVISGLPLANLGGSISNLNLALALIGMGLGFAVGARTTAGIAARLSPQIVCWIALVVIALAIGAACSAVYVGDSSVALVAAGLAGAAMGIVANATFLALRMWVGSDKILRANMVVWIAVCAGAWLGMYLAGSILRLVSSDNEIRYFSAIPLAWIACAVIAALGMMAIRSRASVLEHDLEPRSLSDPEDRSAARSSGSRAGRTKWSRLIASGPSLQMAIGISFFCALSAIGVLTIWPFAAESTGATPANVRLLLSVAWAGLMLGAGLAGLASVGRIELGLVPWGAMVVMIGLIILATRSRDALFTIGDDPLSAGSMLGMALWGIGGSLFALPQWAYLQRHSSDERFARQLGNTHLLVGAALVAGSALFILARVPAGPGSISNLPRDYQLATLTAEQQTLVRDAFSALDRPVAPENGHSMGHMLRIDPVVGALVPAEPRAAAAEAMLPVDVPFRRQIESAPREFYRSIFPDIEESRLDRWLASTGPPIDPQELDDDQSPQALAATLDRAWAEWNREVQSGRGATPPQLNAIMFRLASPPLRRAGLAQILWKLFAAQGLAATPSTATDCAALFPGDQVSQMTVKRVFAEISRQPRMSARQIFLAAGLLWLPIFLFAMWRVPQAMARLPLWWAFRCLYRVRVNGLSNIPPNGGGVFVINHSTYIDGLVILLMSSRRVRMIAWAGNFNNWWMKVLARFAQVILITGGPKSIQKGLSEARKALQRGELVGIFPEGGITRTGQVREFRPGLMRILDQLPVPILPVYIDQIWGSIFSYAGGKAIWKWPRSFRHCLTINIGRPLWRPESIYQVRSAVLEEGAYAVSQRQPPFAAPAQKFIRACKRRRFRSKIADSLGTELTGGMLLARSLMLRDLLRKHVLAADEKIVGVLIPPSVPGVIANMALALDHRIATHLNYTLTEKLINECIQIADVKHILTTRKVLEKFPFKFQCEVVFLEDLREKVTIGQKLRALVRAFAVPRRWLEARLGLGNISPHEMLTVIFTSGSTGTPKGVMLSQQNIATNVDAIGQVICLNPHDTLIGALPFFHSFGYTVTLWGAMSLNVRGAYHVNPLDAQQVGKLTRKFHGTVLLGTPTFLRGYLRKCTPDDFASLNTVVVGAEKLPQELAVAFDHRFGIRPVEGYGTTELSPLVSVNIPTSRTPKNFQPDAKEGSVGRTVPNVAAKITDLDDPSRVLGANSEGMLWIKGPNVMLGYMHRPDLTTQAIVDGWYCTGDVARIDDEGFITLTGRMSRFSKIGGEMIPHIQIEEALLSILSARNYDEQKVAVTAVPDPKRGERLIVLHTGLDETPGELCRKLREMGLPNLFIPSEDSFFRVDAIPILGSGKLDLKRLKEVAIQVANNPPQA